MIKKKVVVGMLALALISVMGLLGCATSDKQMLEKAGVPKNQRADLYLVMYDSQFEKIDGVKQGILGGAWPGLNGALKEAPPKGREMSLKTKSWHPVQVSAGEHTLVISDKGFFVGRKSFEGTFNFEAGKKYVIQLMYPSEYESMQKEGLDWAKDLAKDFGNSVKEGLTDVKIIVIAESKKAVPTFPDSSMQASDWKKSIK